ncbi:WD40 repeat domain-containing serine/threonine protein kinase [Streptomyces sp. NPDC001691]|uniref:WD40 repeat domain-containing serine/threonine protein kinase n=1 Tax=Streptomyces sp. NPDC001691 TaxID=3364600 RepID=UPI003692116B
MDEAVPGPWQAGVVVQGTYQVSGVLGRGGMGVVHRVRHLGWGIDLAVKSPLPELVRHPARRERFVAEAETWVSLGLHPHVCGCHYVRTIGGVPRLFSEFLPGGSLRDRIVDRTLYTGDATVGATARVIDVAVQMAWGLAHAHARGVAHLDVKPANVLLDSDGTVKISDFGLARAGIVPHTSEAPSAAPSPDGRTLTGPAGMTPAYASPEQAAGRRVGRRSDIYSYAVSVLEMFLGDVVWAVGPVAGETLRSLPAGPVGPGLPALPPSVAVLLARCLRPDPADRPASMREVAAELAGTYEELTGSPYPRAEPRPADVRADELNNRALSLLDLGRATEADAAFDAAAEADPRHVVTLYNRGLRRWRRAEITDEDVVRGLEADPAHTDDAGVRRLLAHVHRERGDGASADALHEPGPTAPRPTAEPVAQLDWRASLALTAPVRLAAAHDTTLTGGEGGTARLWDLTTGRCQRTLTVGRHPVIAVDLDHRTCALLSGDTVHVLDADTGRERYAWTVRPPTRAGAPHVPLLDHHAVRVAADGAVCLYAADGTVELWSAAIGHTVLHRAGWGRGAAIGLTPGGRFAVFADHDRLRLWDTTTGESHETQPCAEPMAPGLLVLAADGRSAVTGGHFVGTLRLWNLTTGRCVRTLRGHRGGVLALALSRDGHHLLSSGTDGTVRLWDLATGRCLRTTAPLPDGHYAVDLHLSGESRHTLARGEPWRALLLGSDGALRRLTLPPGTPAPLRLSRPRPVVELTRADAHVTEQLKLADDALSGGRHRAALALLTKVRATPGYERAPGPLAAWRTLARHAPRTALRAAWPGITPSTGQVQSAALSADGTVAAVCHLNGNVDVLDAATGSRRGRIPVSPRTGEPVRLALDAAGDRLLTAERGRISLWSLPDGARLRAFDTGARHTDSLRFSPDSGHALKGAGGYQTELWDLRTGTLVRTLKQRAESVAWHGPRVLVATADNLLHHVAVTDLATGEPALRLEAPRPPGRETPPTGDGPFFMLLRDLTHPPLEWRGVALSGDGRQVLTSDANGELRLWNVADGALVRAFPPAPGHSPALPLLTGDGRFALSTGRDFTIRLWDASTGRHLARIGHHRQPIEGLALARDGRRALSWSHVDGVRVWELDWELAPPPDTEWDEAATPYIDGFRARHTGLCPDAGLDALMDLLRDTGHGWLHRDAVRARLEAPGA